MKPPIDELKIVRDYIVESFGEPCDDFSAGCINCFVWAGWDAVESWAEYDSKERVEHPESFPESDPED